jgi:hypothetical protein
MKNIKQIHSPRKNYTDYIKTDLSNYYQLEFIKFIITSLQFLAFVVFLGNTSLGKPKRVEITSIFHGAGVKNASVKGGINSWLYEKSIIFCANEDWVTKHAIKAALNSVYREINNRGGCK